MIQGLEPVDSGKVVTGETVVFGYYSQDLIKVDENKKVIDVIRDIAEYIPLEKGKQMTAAQFLERFLFNRNMHYNYVYKLHQSLFYSKTPILTKTTVKHI